MAILIAIKLLTEGWDCRTGCPERDFCLLGSFPDLADYKVKEAVLS